MSPERPPSQSMGGNNMIEQQSQQQIQQQHQIISTSNTTTANTTNMVLSTIPIDNTGHVVFHRQQQSVTANGTNGTTYTQITRNGVPQNLVVSSSPPHLTSKTISALSATSSPSKYVVIHQNGNGQYRTADGTPAYLTTQSNGVGNIVLLATEPMDMTNSEQSSIIVNANGQVADEELTPLTWLQDKDLLKDLVARTNGAKTAATASPTRQSNGNGGGTISPTSDFLEDSSVSEDNVSSVNSSSDQGISISSAEFSPTSSTSSCSSAPNSSFAPYHQQSQQSIQYHQVSVATTNHHQPHSVSHFINNNSVTKNRNHLLSPSKTASAITQSLAATSYISSPNDVNAPKTVMFNGPSGTTTVVEYKAGSNFSPPSTRQILTSHTILSPQRSPTISGNTTVTITSAGSLGSQTPSPNSPLTATFGGGSSSSISMSMTTSTPSTTPHQHFHKKYIREQMNGVEQQSHHQLQRSRNDSLEYGAAVNGSQQQCIQGSFQHGMNSPGPEEFHRTPIKPTDQLSSYNHNSSNGHDERLLSRETFNFDSPTGVTTLTSGRSLSTQKVSSAASSASSSSSSSSTSTAPSPSPAATSSAAASPKQKHPTNVPYDPMVHTTNKPPYSFSSLIFMAIEDSPEKALPVKEIYAWIMQHFPYFKTAPTGWKNSVRHNLSLNKSFQKVEKAPNMGKGSLWRVEEHQRQNLMQALARSPFHQSTVADKFSPFKSNSASVSSVSRSVAPDSPPSPIKSTYDPELFPNLYKTFKDMANKNGNGNGESGADRDGLPSHQVYAYNGVNGSHNGTRDYYRGNGQESENGTGSLDYSIERLARNCGADSIDDVNAATAMLALKHGPNIFNESFQNGSPVITSSPSEDHTYSAGGGGSSGGGTGVNSANHSQNGSDNNSSGICSDAAYESGDERSHRSISVEELEEQRRRAEGVDALLSFASSAASSPTKRPSSTSVEDEHMLSYTENIPQYISATENGTTTSASTRFLTHGDGSETILYHHPAPRLSTSSSGETPNYYLSALPSAAKKLKAASRGIRTKSKRKTTLIR